MKKSDIIAPSVEIRREKGREKIVVVDFFGVSYPKINFKRRYLGKFLCKDLAFIV